MREPIDDEVRTTWEQAQPELPAGWQARVQASMSAEPKRRPRRWLAFAVATAVVLAGLGFVPIPLGKAKGAFGKALAMVNGATGVHVTGRIWGPLGEWRFEQWFTKDGFRRFDLLDGDRVTDRWLYDPGTRTMSPRFRETEPGLRGATRTLPNPGNVWETAPLIGPDAQLGLRNLREEHTLPDTMLRWRVQKEPVASDFWQRIDEQKAPLEVKVDEHERYTLWGGKRVVADVYGHRRKGAFIEVLILGNIMGSVYTSLGPGDDVWVHMEADPETGAIEVLEQYKRIDGEWRLIYSVDSIEFGAEMTDAVRNPELPPHHNEVVDTWWQERLPQVVAQGESEDWRVTLNSLEMSRNGDVFLTLSREPKTDVTWNVRDNRTNLPLEPTRDMEVNVSDNLGSRYIQAGIAHPETLLRAGIKGRDAINILWPFLPEGHVRVHLTPELPPVSGPFPRRFTIRVANEPARSIPEITGVTSLPQEDFDAFTLWFKNTYWQPVTFTGIPVAQAQPGDDLIQEAIHETKR